MTPVQSVTSDIRKVDVTDLLDFKEDIIAVPLPSQTAAKLRPLLEECGYSDDRLQPDFRLGSKTIPLVGFASKPWDFDSACIAVVDGPDDPKAAAKSCRDLGAPVVWVMHNGIVDWWSQHGADPTRYESKPFAEFSQLVRQRKDKLDPASIYRGKTIARVDTARQLDFVDAGLLPLLREEAGKKLHDLVQEMIREILGILRQNNPSKDLIQNVFISVFRMLAGKILKDKGVHGFKTLDLNDPRAILSAVGRHYDASQSNAPVCRPQGWQAALESAATKFNGAGSFGVISPETFAYVYEHTLVTKSLRKKLGIHATPPWLVDYMVWQLYDWIREIPADDRHVFEPACGHAPFLLSAMRLLRLEMQSSAEANAHTYLKNHLHGIEIDEFAREIARLSLTLADIPSPNGWDLLGGDMFMSDILMRESSNCKILLCNPPYEQFDLADKKRYRSSGYPVLHKKAVELLRRTLLHMKPGSIFGIVVPQSVISGPEAKDIRKLLLTNFEVAEACLFPGKVFEFAQIETAIILGRYPTTPRTVSGNRVRLRTIGEHGMSAFKDNYATIGDKSATQSRLMENPACELKLPALDDVWQFLRQNSRLRNVATIGRGIEYKSDGDRSGTPVVLDKPARGYEPGFAGVSREQLIFTTPPVRFLATQKELIGNPRQGNATGDPQILVNMGRTARSPWRIKAILDTNGIHVKNNFAVIRPTNTELHPIYLWSIINSPLANAFVSSWTMRKHNYESILGGIPIPNARSNDMANVVSLANHYFKIALELSHPTEPNRNTMMDHAPLFHDPTSPKFDSRYLEVRQALIALDAMILRLYALPTKLERQLLDYFRGHERRGVGCEFGDYYPSEYQSLVPLYKYVSSSYRDSTVDQVVARMKPGESSAVVAALDAAAEAFSGDE